jgi:UDP-N-acetylglucosamine--N-acetylmuramyl-(pentapeptide) pyrophosphoryl-undecaprenol N-acetylglucosamine transferase
MRVMVAGGGTGGHFYPGLAILEGLREHDPDVRVAYVGTRTGIEARALPAHPWIRFYPIHVRGSARRGLIRDLGTFLRLVVGLLETLLVLARFRPQIVIGVGGYSSFPPVLLGALLGRVLRVRTVIHEQNVVAGLANRWLSRFVDVVLVSFPQTERSFPRARRLVVTGNPIREEFLHVKRSDGLYRRFGLDPRRRTILVYGGSKGSAEITERILRAVDAIRANDGLQILLVTGSDRATDTIRRKLSASGVRNIVVESYVDHMGAAFAVADLVVCRAGATSLAEITACGKASVLIPWRNATDDHQRKNARMLQEEGACAVVDDAGIVEPDLVRLIANLIRDELALDRLGENAGRLGKRDAVALVLGEIQTMMRGARA